MFNTESLQHLLEKVAKGAVSPAIALEKLKHFDFEPIEDFAKIDHHRPLRTGFPEVIWSPGKTVEQIAQIMNRMGKNAPVVMATRVEATVYEQLQHQVPNLEYYPIARIAVIKKTDSTVQYPGNITILTAGTADLPVAEEAAITAELCGFQVQRLWDVGVAGIHRLLSHRQLLHQAQVLIVVAGMEGALPSVVAGMANCPVIGVPTSVGYGASFGGIAPLLTMLNSCATGIGVVNIDNGFGAAILAGQILRTGAKLEPISQQQTPCFSSEWQLVYAHNHEGEMLAGDIEHLKNGVRQGASIRFLIEGLDEGEYLTDAQHLWIKENQVYAQNTSQVSMEFKGEMLHFSEKASHVLMIASTNGDFNITRWLMGKHKHQNHRFQKVSIRWFMR